MRLRVTLKLCVNIWLNESWSSQADFRHYKEHHIGRLSLKLYYAIENNTHPSCKRRYMIHGISYYSKLLSALMPWT